MVTQEIALDKLSQFIKEYDSDRFSLELLLFLGRHPRTRFSHLAIVHALNAWKVDIERALRRLKERGLVRTYSENGTSFYSLTEDESLCSPVLDLLKSDRGQWQPVLKDIYPAAKE